MKRKIALALVGILVLSSVACGQKESATQPATEVTEEAETSTTEVADDEVQQDGEESDAEASTEVEEDVENVNLLANGDFTQGSENWGLFVTRGGVAEFTVEEGVGKLDILSVGTDDYSNQLYYDGFALKMGGVYEFQFDISSTIPRNIEARIQLNGGTYDAYISEHIDITEEMQTFTFTFEMAEGNDPAPRLCFNVGQVIEGESFEQHVLSLDNVSVKLVDGSNIVNTEIVDQTVDCNTNQVGFLPDARKTVVIRGENPGKEFKIVDESGKEVYTGTLSDAIDSVNAGETVYFGEFTDFTTPGTYHVVSGEGAESYPFVIGEGVYDELLVDAFRMMYLQRCGMELTEDMAGDFAHPDCHMGEAVIYGTDETKEVCGGWHDAGDYGRYVVSGVEAAQDLLLSYEDFPEIWAGENADNMGIPESGNGIPDILDEVKYELDWLLKMQDEETGGVYHKVTCLEFPGFVMPQEETAQLVLAPISTTATADFAAVMAKSSEVYKELYPEFAAQCLEAAKRAWAYLEVTPNGTGYKNPDDILTGEYPDGQDKDERFWAATELYKVTGEEKYNKYLEETMDKYILHGYGWADMGTFGNMTYLSLDESLQNPVYVEKMKQMILEKADKYLENAKADGYNVALGDNYCWASNQVACNYARHLLLAEEISGNSEYGTYAYDQLSYVLGQNTLSYCFLSGYGSVSPVNVHHRPCMATGTVMKGMVIGGPNSNLEDPFTKSTMAGVAPAKCYIDNDQSYSTNEVTIYWNSPFIYLLSSQM